MTDLEQTTEAQALPRIGAWVADFSNPAWPRLAQVKDAYVQQDRRLLDLVIFDHLGNRVGRESEACGGPRGYEPACEAEAWTEIEMPDFERMSREKWNLSKHIQLRSPVSADDAIEEE